jgi:hypothetical protein
LTNDTADHRQWIWLGGVLLLAAVLRTAGIMAGPFLHGDDINVAWRVVHNFPRGLDSFVPFNMSVEPNPIGILTDNHGALLPLWLLAAVTVAASLGSPVTAGLWHLLATPVGLVAVVAAFALVTELAGWRSGLLAALFVAVSPAQTASSRSSGASAYMVLAFALHAFTLWMVVRALREPGRKRFAWGAGLGLALNSLTDVGFPLLFLVVGVVLVACGSATSLRARLVHSVRWFLQPALLVPVGGAALFHIGLTVGGRSGIVARVLDSAGDSNLLGWFGVDFLQTLHWANSPLALAAAGACVALLASGARRLGVSSEARVVPLGWLAVYGLPFLVLINRDVQNTKFIAIEGAMLVASAIVSGALVDRSRPTRARVAGSALAAAIVVGSVAATLNWIWGVSAPALLRHADRSDYGAVRPDTGVEAMAAWIRANVPPRARVFVDPYGGTPLEPAVALYYFHRPVLGQYLNARNSVEGLYRNFEDSAPPLDFAVVGPGGRHRFEAAAGDDFGVRATVYGDAGRPLLHLYERRWTGTEEAVDSARGGAEYRARYTSLADIVDLDWLFARAAQR